MPRLAYLPNPVYSALITAEASFASTHGVALRFQADVIPFGAVPEPTAAALSDLVPLLAHGEEIYVTTDEGQSLEPVSGLDVVSTMPGLQMRLGREAPQGAEEEGVFRLGRDDVEDMIALKARAFPGYFGPRAPELGVFFGIRDPITHQLVAMGGERLATFTDREVSAVCTDPNHLGRGYAARVVRSVLRHQARLGIGSLLHVTANNRRAIALYERLGFELTGSLDFVRLRRT